MRYGDLDEEPSLIARAMLTISDRAPSNLCRSRVNSPSVHNLTLELHIRDLREPKVNGSFPAVERAYEVIARLNEAAPALQVSIKLCRSTLASFCNDDLLRLFPSSKCLGISVQVSTF